MKERPILFSAPMVRALLAGTKTQTRRAIKAKHQDWIKVYPQPFHGGDGRLNYGWDGNAGGSLCCPYGQPGDRLWVRETFYCDNAFYPDGVGVSCMWREVNGQRVAVPVEEQRAKMLAEDMYYRADGDPEFEGAEGPTPWRPSIHMPRWASRILLEVVAVRVERLQDISAADARLEGVWPATGVIDLIVAITKVGEYFGIDPTLQLEECSRLAYRMLWEQINGAGSWESNPWVWVVEFKRVEG